MKHFVLAALLVSSAATYCHASQNAATVCARPPAGSPVSEPEDLRSKQGVLEVDLTAENTPDTNASIRYCFADAAGRESPNLRVSPRDLVIIHLKNALRDLDHAEAHVTKASMPHAMEASSCTSGMMGPVSTNLHFHGLTIPPVCHQDDVMKTSVQPGDPPFEYRFRIPQDEPPGLYWYHPHIHGFSKQQVLGGASGALIVEGIERAKNSLAGLPERVFIIRDLDLIHPNAVPDTSEPLVPKFLIDRDGDAANNGTGFGKPAKDLSINYVPVPFPDYTPAVINMKPGERQLWRVLNASAITYLNLEVIVHRSAQPLGIVAMDGVPLTHDDPRGDQVNQQTHIGLPRVRVQNLSCRDQRKARLACWLRRLSTQAPAARMIRTACWRESSHRRLRLSLAPLLQVRRPRYRRRINPGSAMWHRFASGICTSLKSLQTPMILRALSSSTSP